MRVEENKALAPMTTLGVGGGARWFIEAAKEENVAEAAAWTRARGVPLFVLGGGSNLLVADEGFDGAVLHMELRGVRRLEEAGHVLYQVAAGEDWDAFVSRCVTEDCAGVECLAGIPGTIGGTPVQNVGAYGQEVAASIETVRAYDLKAGKFVELSNAECGFAYRRSRFNTVDRGRYVVTRVDYRLAPAGAPTLGYAELQRAFATTPKPSLQEVADMVRRIRSSKGMLLQEGDPDCRSAGSFFKNPVVTDQQVKQIASVAGKIPPTFPVAEPGKQHDRIKVPAAWLIEQSGFTKGFARGAAGISSKHPLALINRGGARASEILALADEIASAVFARFGVLLEREPVLLGFENLGS
jgi:UDP-N-acetylmuramate dehydrogenase